MDFLLALKPPGSNTLPWLPTTVQPIEIAWTVLGILGLYYALSNFLEARADVIALEKRNVDGVASVVVQGTVVVESIRFAMQLLIVLIGVLAMFSAPSAPPPNLLLSTVIVISLFLISAGLTFKSWYSRRLRRTAKDKLDLIEQDLRAAAALDAEGRREEGKDDD